MFAKLLFPKLREAETVTIQTKLTRQVAIERLNKETGAPVSLSNLGSYFMREDPLFRGKIDSDRFELRLFSDRAAFLSNFQSPTIKGAWRGDDPLTIEAEIAFTKYDKTLIKSFSGFVVLFFIFIFFIPQIGLGTAYFENLQGGGEFSNVELSFKSYLGLALIAFLLSCFVSIVVHLVFVRSPIFFMNRAMRHSIEAFSNLFE